MGHSHVAMQVVSFVSHSVFRRWEINHGTDSSLVICCRIGPWPAPDRSSFARPWKPSIGKSAFARKPLMCENRVIIWNGLAWVLLHKISNITSREKTTSHSGDLVSESSSYPGICFEDGASRGLELCIALPSSGFSASGPSNLGSLPCDSRQSHRVCAEFSVQTRRTTGPFWPIFLGPWGGWSQRWCMSILNIKGNERIQWYHYYHYYSLTILMISLDSLVVGPFTAAIISQNRRWVVTGERSKSRVRRPRDSHGTSNVVSIMEASCDGDIQSFTNV